MCLQTHKSRYTNPQIQIHKCTACTPVHSFHWLVTSQVPQPIPTTHCLTSTHPQNLLTHNQCTYWVKEPNYLHRPMQWTQKSKDMWCNATDLLDHFVFKTSSIRETYMADKDLRAGGYLRMISEKLKSRTQTKEGRSSIIRTPTITQERSDLPSGGKSNVTKPTIASHLKNPNCVTDHCCNLNIVITTFNISNQI